MTFQINWPTQYGTITQQFNQRPEFYAKFGLPGHEGLDFQAPEGSEIYAAADGVVSEVRLDGDSDPLHKPYGNQVRIQHAGPYLTIYAHLSHVVVSVGQPVKAGQLVGLAGNTGNSFGAHLHLTLKKEGATGAGETNYPYDIVDPSSYLEPFSGGPPVQPPPPAQATLEVEVYSPEAGHLNVRSAPYVGSARIAQVNHGAKLGALEAANVARGKVGQQGEWLWVRTAAGKVGYVAAWYLRLPDAPAPPAMTVSLVVESPQVALKVRQGPGTGYAQVGQAAHGTVLAALEDEPTVKRKVGQHGEWLHVETPSGVSGYSAAWYLRLHADAVEPPPLEPPPGEVRYVRVESPEFGLKVRQGPGTTHAQVWWLPHGTTLESLEDPATTAGKIGGLEQWLKVRSPSQVEGYVAAWYLKKPPAADNRQPAVAGDLPQGLSPYIFGIHAVTPGDDPHTRDPIRRLYHGKPHKGWVFFTEQVGQGPQDVGPNDDVRSRLWDWAQQGYGVIVRLNRGYEPAGTLPESRYYGDFAAACARYAELMLERPELAPEQYTWTIQIANEQNNPREHPGGWEHPREHITPALYAQAFNQAYAAIKAVLPNAIVCTGAVDPYNSAPLKLLGGARWRPLDYFTDMLAGIDALDGIILHAYTHGPAPGAITSLKTFADPLLKDHYFDFQTYRQFLERVPARWRDVPVYITETNHICRRASAPLCDRPNEHGWENENSGWVRELYKEVDRWNRTPYAQQVRCALLYRWMGDAWSLHDKPGVLEDFKQALDNDYRWRASQAARGPMAVEFGAGAVAPLEERSLAAADDLQRIRGIGPQIEKLLRAAGIGIYEQLAALEPGQIRAILAEAGMGAKYVETWPEQARQLVAGKLKGAEVLGRRKYRVI
ncbi:MAG: SH3 domain-containing protein [Anaerolineae bacterium]|nr:SH3 domain-containing protein [Anaerolineae bacterium]